LLTIRISPNGLARRAMTGNGAPSQKGATVPDAAGAVKAKSCAARDSTAQASSTQAEEAQDRGDHDHQADDVDDAVHGASLLIGCRTLSPMPSVRFPAPGTQKQIGRALARPISIR
jgi:hypothetical protein